MKNVGARGMAALKNWKRPSMDEFPVPKEPFIQVETELFCPDAES